jgi:hypothetical protein
MTAGWPVFDVYTEFKRLGQNKLQELCDSWVSSPLAREFAVSKLTVETVSGRLCLSPQMKMTHTVRNGEAYYFPTDELLLYVADKTIDDLAERDAVKARVVANRQRCGPDVYRRFILQPGPKLPIFITCKNPNCRNVIVTQLTAYRCEQQEWDLEPIECPRCKQSFKYDGSDFHFGPNNA